MIKRRVRAKFAGIRSRSCRPDSLLSKNGFRVIWHVAKARHESNEPRPSGARSPFRCSLTTSFARGSPQRSGGRRGHQQRRPAVPANPADGGAALPEERLHLKRRVGGLALVAGSVVPVFQRAGVLRAATALRSCADQPLQTPAGRGRLPTIVQEQDRGGSRGDRPRGPSRSA